jgi:hypothetical protein
VSSSITGSAVTRAIGGQGASTSFVGVAGGANTGTGGSGGGGGPARDGGAGGSGLVVFKVPDYANVTFSGGVTSTSSTAGGFTVYTVTATSTTSETVTIL